MRSFFVPGKPIGQGAITTINRRTFHSNDKELRPWREAIGWCAKAAKIPVLDGAVRIELEFIIPRPKTVKREYPTVPSDLDHYIRAVGDALKGIAFLDDSQICSIKAEKVYGETPGVRISIEPLQ